MSALLGMVGLYWIGRSFVVDGKLRFGNPVQGMLPLGTEREPGADEPEVLRAEVTRFEGKLRVGVGDKCEALVRRRTLPQGGYECNAQVLCSDSLLYGGQPMSGYFGCKMSQDGRNVIGYDAKTSRQDGDPALRIDTRSGVLKLSDDESGPNGAFLLEADIYGVR